LTAQDTSSPGLLRVLVLFGLILAGLAVVGIVAWHHLTDTQTVATNIAKIRPWLAAWRAALFVVLVGLWPRLINSLADRYRWSEPHRRYITAQRWRVSVWLIVIELVLVQNLIGKFVNGFVP